MELRRELLLTIVALVVLNLLLAFGSIGLFVRMGPAIERILEENVFSIMAAEDMLAELAHAGEAPLSAAARARLEASFTRVEQNVTEDAERSVIVAIEARASAAAEGDSAARHAVLEDIRHLIRINRDAMQRVDADARRLGSAGAWAAVLIGFLSFLLSLVVIVRLQSRFVRPLVDLYEVLESAREGNRHRRCRMSEAPREVVQVTQAVNRLLDERLTRDAS